MASTEIPGVASGAAIRPLIEADLPDCLALSRAAQWNQNEADWRMLLALGRGWGIAGSGRGPGNRLAASVVILPYPRGGTGPEREAAAGTGCAWVSMVLVLPSYRRKGLATRLLRHAVAFLQGEGLLPVLDATPAGYPVYRQEGFTPAWGFRRYTRVAACLDPAAAAPRSRPITAMDWPAVMALDAPVFGVDREQVLRSLAARLPEAARVAERHGRIVGFVFGRDGLEASQIGPLMAEDAETAQELLDDVLNAVTGPVLLDLADRHLALLEGLVARGFLLQRPFTRMAQGAAPPGDPERLVLVAGPELG